MYYEGSAEKVGAAVKISDSYHPSAIPSGRPSQAVTKQDVRPFSGRRCKEIYHLAILLKAKTESSTVR